MEIIENKTQGNTIGIKIDGKVTLEDYKKVIPKFKERLQSNDTINCYMEVKSIEGISPEAIWRDMKFSANHLNDLKKVALVGDKSWVDWLTRLSKPFISAKVNLYEPADKDKAWEWVSSS